MRRGLLFALGIATLLAAASAWTDRPVQAVAALATRPLAISALVVPAARDAVTGPTGAPVAWAEAAPEARSGHGLEDAKRDIFSPRPAPGRSPPLDLQVASVAAPLLPRSEAVPLAVPAAAPAPSPELRYIGRMTAVEGRQLLYMARGAAEFPVVEGQQLDGGYAVTSLSEDVVTLAHPTTGATATVRIPRDRTR